MGPVINASSKLESVDVHPQANAPNLSVVDKMQYELGKSERSDSMSSKNLANKLPGDDMMY